MEEVAVQAPAPAPAPVAPPTPASATAQATKTIGTTLLNGLIVGFAIGAGFILAQRLFGKKIVVHQATPSPKTNSNFAGEGNYPKRNHQRSPRRNPMQFNYQGSDPRNHRTPMYQQFDGSDSINNAFRQMNRM